MQAALDGWIAKQQNPDAPQPLQNLVINVPPGTAKSRIVSVFSPAWMWLRWPSWRAIFLSANPRVALRDSVYCRELIESDWYQQTFLPPWKLARRQNAKSLYKNTAGGYRYAAGFASRITGDRADAIVWDDPHDAEEAKSDAMRQAVLDRWDSAIGNRVNDLRCSLRIGIMQRLHEADLAGHVIAQGWQHLCLPMEFDPGKAQPSVIGWRDPRTKEGELLFPQRFPPEVLAAERKRLGADGYAGQMQQDPAPAEGMIFKKAWFSRRYRSYTGLKEVWTVWDTALKEKEQNDESAYTVFGLLDNGDILILAAASGHWETPDIEQFLCENADWMRKVYGAKYRGDYIEDKVSGTTLMRYIKRNRPDLALIPIPAELDKIARAHGVSPLVEAERVLLPDPAIYPDTMEWAQDFLKQVCIFPKGRFKDLTDTFVYGLMRVMGTLGKRKTRRSKSGGLA